MTITSTRFRLAITLLLAAVFAGCGLKGEYRSVEEFKMAVDGAEKLLVEAVNGSIALKPGDEDAVKAKTTLIVNAVSDAEAERFSQSVGLAPQRAADAIKFAPKHPKLGWRHKLTVHYEIECPPELMANLKLVNGNLQVEGMNAPLAAQTVNGYITIKDGADAIGANTVNGNIDAELNRVDTVTKLQTVNGIVTARVDSCQGELHGITVNGIVDVTLPESYQGSLDASTVTGRVNCEFDMTYDVEKKTHLNGRIGDLDSPSQLFLNAVNGNVSLKKAPAEEPPV